MENEMIYHTVDMRRTAPPPIRFGDLYSYNKWITDCAKARALQTVQFACAPLCSLTTKTGLKRAGDEVRADDFHPAELQKLLDSGAILAKPEPEPESNAEAES